MDTFSEMLESGGNIGPNQAQISSGALPRLDLMCRGKSFNTEKRIYSSCNGVKLYFACCVYMTNTFG